LCGLDSSYQKVLRSSDTKERRETGASPAPPRNGSWEDVKREKEPREAIIGNIKSREKQTTKNAAYVAWPPKIEKVSAGDHSKRGASL